jgi:hypothetical protein
LVPFGLVVFLPGLGEDTRGGGVETLLGAVAGRGGVGNGGAAGVPGGTGRVSGLSFF